MQVCKVCSIPMTGIMSFSKERHEKFCRCPKCRRDTKHKLLRNCELDFGEVLHREYQKQKSKNR